MVVLWLMLNIVDWGTSVVYGNEWNPLLKQMTASVLLSYKIIGALLVVAGLIYFARLYLLKWMVLGMFVIVLWNIVNILLRRIILPA